MSSAARPTGGLRNVAVSESRLSSIDGERGILAYRGIDIHALAEQSGFEETSFLLHEGRLPGRAELEAWRSARAAERAVPDPAVRVVRALPRNAHPMPTLRTAVSALGAADPEARDDSLPAARRKSRRLIAQMGTLVAGLNLIRGGRSPVAPDPKL